MGIKYVELNKCVLQIDTDSEKWKKHRELYIEGNFIGIKMQGTYYNPDVLEIIVHGGFWDMGSDFATTLKSFLEKAYEISGNKDIAEALKLLDEQYFEKLFKAISTAYRVVTDKLSKMIDEREKKIQWWSSVKKKAIDAWYKRDIVSMRDSATSVYLDDATVRKGDKKLMEEIMKNGKLIDRFYLSNKFQTKTEILVYEYQGKTYAIEKYWFNNLQGMDIEQWTLYRIFS